MSERERDEGIFNSVVEALSLDARIKIPLRLRSDSQSATQRHRASSPLGSLSKGGYPPPFFPPREPAMIAIVAPMTTNANRSTTSERSDDRFRGYLPGKVRREREEGEIERENRDRRHRSMQTSGLPRVSIFSPLETRRDIPFPSPV